MSAGFGPLRDARVQASIAAISSGREREVENVEVLGDALGAHRLGDGAEAVLQMPAEHDLRRSLAVLPGQAGDDRCESGSRASGLSVK